MMLNARKVEAAKGKEKSYKLADGGGLYLQVEPNGSRYWRMKYRFAGKEKRLSFGVYPAVSLADTTENAQSLWLCIKVIKPPANPCLIRKKTAT